MYAVILSGMASIAHGESSALCTSGSTPFFGAKAVLPVSLGAK